MTTTTKALRDLRAGDLMSRDVLVLRQELPLREAARRMLQRQVGGAPVVDVQGRCIGVLSAADFVRLAATRDEPLHVEATALPLTCGFQAKHRRPDGSEATLCLLPAGACPLQQAEAGGLLVCRDPHAVLCDWQVVELEMLPETETGRYMTRDPVTVGPDTPLRDLARMMLDAHIHRIIVVDEEARPIGVVSTTDILAAIAYAGDDTPS